MLKLKLKLFPGFSTAGAKNARSRCKKAFRKEMEKHTHNKIMGVQVAVSMVHLNLLKTIYDKSFICGFIINFVTVKILF
jgi:hypothetical protein